MKNFYFGVNNYNLDNHTGRGNNVLCGPYSTREEAKRERQQYSSIDFEFTDVFMASSTEEANNKMNEEPFGRI